MTGAAEDPAAYGLGDRIPTEAYKPADVAELAAIVGDCNTRGRAAVLFGGATLQSLGNAPARYDTAIALTKLDRIVAYEHRDLTIAVEAGCTIETLDATLAAAGQFVPLDAPRARHATVGGTLAAGWRGPRRSAYGRSRDFVIGTTVVLADGTIASAGGMVVKNATGYDLSKLYIGSLGTLAAIVRVNFKTLPLPETRRIAIAALPEGSRAHAVARIAALDVEPSAALVVRGFANEIDGRDGVDGRLVLLFEGSLQSVERATRGVRSALGSAGVPETRLVDREAAAAFMRVLDAYIAALASRSATYLSTGAPSRSSERLESYTRLARAHDLHLETIEDLRTGDVIARLSTTMTRDFAKRLLAFDAQPRTTLAGARLVAAPQALHAKLQAWGAPPTAIATMHALKDRFDPKGTLAPGRYVGGI